MKLLYLFLINLFYIHSQAQDSIKLFYINKIALNTTDSAMISQCKKATYKTASVEIYMIDKTGRADTTYSSANDFYCWKDSVSFSYTIPAAIYKNNASLIVHPVYNIACSGLNGNRGTENLEAEGTESTVRSINLKFISNPPGAKVYLIPKLIWERTPGLSGMKNQAVLNHYILYNGETPVSSTAQEYVYIALFKYNGKFLPVECSPTHSKPDDSVYANFIQQ